MTRPAVMRVYLAGDGWRWRLVACNGNIVADSGQSYSEKWRARRAAAAVARVAIVTADGETLR